MTAKCADCHTAHRELPASDPRSTVNRNNIAADLREVSPRHLRDVHKPASTRRWSYHDDKPLPRLQRLPLLPQHRAHGPGGLPARTSWTSAAAVTRRSRRATSRRSTARSRSSDTPTTAKCYDCHGAHDILPPTDPRVAACRAPTSSRPAASAIPARIGSSPGYLTHATHHDPKQVPVPLLHVLGHDDAAGRHARGRRRPHAALAAALAGR